MTIFPGKSVAYSRQGEPVPHPRVIKFWPLGVICTDLKGLGGRSHRAARPQYSGLSPSGDAATEQKASLLWRGSKVGHQSRRPQTLPQPGAPFPVSVIVSPKILLGRKSLKPCFLLCPLHKTMMKESSKKERQYAHTGPRVHMHK